MVPSRSASPNRRGSTGSFSTTSINTRIVPFISNYYSLLGDSPNSLVDLHVSNPDPHLKWQIPSFVIGGNPRIQGSTIIDNGIISIKSFGKDTLHNLFSSLPTITCKIPVEIMDINETTENIVTVSIHGHVISGSERFLFFQVLQILHQLDHNNKDNFLIFNNIFYVFPVPFDMKSMRSLQTFSNQPSISHSFSFAHTPKSTDLEDYDGTKEVEQEATGDHSQNLNNQQQHHHHHQQNHHIKTFPTYQDSKKTTKIKPQIKIHGLFPNLGLSDKDILSAVSFQLKNSNEGFAIAINRSNDEAIVQVDSVQSQELLSQRGIYIQGLKYKVSSIVKKPNSGNRGNRNSNKNKNNSQTEDGGPSSSSAPKKMNSHKKEVVPDKDGWITVTSKGKSKSKTF